MSVPENEWWTPWREIEGAELIHVDLRPDPEREAFAFSLLDDEEKARLRRFVVERAKRQFVLCRGALRIQLSQRLDCSNRPLSFDYLEHGKPVARVNGRRDTIGFNVSHGGRHGLMAFSERGELGVDVEERLPRRDLDGIGSKVNGPLERQTLAAAAGAQKVHLFYRLWSLKEALIKALGTGFSLNPSRFEVPEAMLEGARSSDFRFPHSPDSRWRLHDLGEPRFAAALAWRVHSCRSARCVASPIPPAMRLYRPWRYDRTDKERRKVTPPITSRADGQS